MLARGWRRRRRPLAPRSNAFGISSRSCKPCPSAALELGNAPSSHAPAQLQPGARRLNGYGEATHETSATAGRLVEFPIVCERSTMRSVNRLLAALVALAVAGLVAMTPTAAAASNTD